MSGPPRARSGNAIDREIRSVLGPAGNKLQRKPTAKKPEKLAAEETAESKDAKPAKMTSLVSPKTTPSQCSPLSPSILRRSNVSMTASYSSDASSSCESSPMSAGSLSSGKRAVRRGGSISAAAMVASAAKRKQAEEIEEKVAGGGDCCFDGQKRCAWITPKTDPCYVAFHDEEWGVPVHDDKKLFELLCLSGALAELSWSDILAKRQLFREVFLDFDPLAVSELNDKKITVPGTIASSLLSELKLRSILENARQVRKITVEYGSFGKYIWNFVNNKTIQSQFRYHRQVPVKTSKAEFISKDLIRRGFRSVSPTVIYSFMQAAGLTNDHLTSCFRFQDCMAEADMRLKDDVGKGNPGN
ncbi:PREDICTED: uncharacterized protein LOC104808178 isoform X2 [Tarenaya hassleriana]|uniref:uncharacterized protein LOC104808178 isoform X2 n=1 Tax=Tarenaya hassleriana TaxID=28532 RepID=UPI00053CA27E|nr:PREDICTED: uncharacterized protein LOC104808178 isoform X2 [Tarenaya hassleriana]